MTTALISVSDKTGIVDFARALHALGIRLVSTGGTAKLLADNALPVTEVAELTGFPEMLDGRVKTLHPAIHGGLLARRDVAAHMAALEQHGIGTIDLLVVNLYPFEATVAKPGCTLDDAIENIDIGGPAMVRSAAKNWNDVAVLTDASQYAGVLDELKRDGAVSRATRFALAVAAFNRISNYDAAISDYLSALQPDGARGEFPAQSNGRFVKVQDLRYGENPHQRAAFYRDLYPAPGSLVTAVQLQGKELSYNNIADADAAWECVKSFDACACVIVKHANPCGVALGATPAEAYAKAFKTDPTSAFGGIIAFNRPLDGDGGGAGRQAVRRGADRAGLYATKRVRRSQRSRMRGCCRSRCRRGERGRNSHDAKRVGSGLLMQTADNREVTRAELKVVTKQQPTPQQLDDLLFAWTVAKYVKSNAIVFAGRRHDARRRRRPDEPHRLGAHRVDQGRQRRAVAAGLGGGERCVLPVSRRPRRGGRCGRRLRHPAGRQRARRRSDRGGRRARRRDGVHRGAALSALSRNCWLRALRRMSA